MATYKIPQNVEAEDKLIGPFSFKQFIFLILAAISILMAWLFAQISPFLLTIPLPFIVVFLVLGIYHREDQPVETFLLAALNFTLKPRRRIWNPEGLIETVRITAPKLMASPRLKNLALEHGQLERLAKIVDTRGWIAKQSILTEPIDEHVIDVTGRLALQTARVEAIDVHASDDMFDAYNNPRGQDFSDLATSSYTQAKESAIAKMQDVMNVGQPPPVQTNPAKPKAKAQAKPAEAAPSPPAPLPTNIHYNPFPVMQQRVVDPATGAATNSSQTFNDSPKSAIPPTAQSGTDHNANAILSQADADNKAGASSQKTIQNESSNSATKSSNSSSAGSGAAA